MSKTKAVENINILSCGNFSTSSHPRKEAFSVEITKNPSHEYRGTIGFSMDSIDPGKYTLVFECFPSADLGTIVAIRTTLLSRNSRTFTNYSKMVVSFEKSSSSNQYVYFIAELLSGDSSSPTKKSAYMIVYGVKGEHSSVPPSVYKKKGFFDHQGEATIHGHLNMAGHRIYQLADPGFPAEAATKRYVDNLDPALPAQTQDLDMNGHRIRTVLEPEYSTDASIKGYVDKHHQRLRRDVESHLQEDSDKNVSVFQRAVNMQNHKIQNSGLCTAAGDAANKNYVDSAGIISVLNLAASVLH